MKTATIADTRSHLSALLDEIAGGGEIVITRRGKPVARLVGEPPSTPFDWSDLRDWVVAAPAANGLSVAEMREQNLL
ncbi:type II toxin-antitoxin system Phd/YefM family antitoxin [Accumulibacter sp.]|uniref:type II toxin-antitoxin system Phd/YefM family antitoxin n=1 Tax=Accumulibacter sp. TaxID=2053492 RepID=UPI002614801C|nr:type II toxin-antitoxin system Phd/YefM family antitoxin [Accumulibacter sp.]